VNLVVADEPSTGRNGVDDPLSAQLDRWLRDETT
jgi:hypothetical protein